MSDEMPKWRKALLAREGSLYEDELVKQVSVLPFFMREKLRIWLAEQEIEEFTPEETEMLEYVKKEVVSYLPLVPKDELKRILQIVQLYAGGK